MTDYKCPYCTIDSYSITSRKQGKFDNWLSVRKHTTTCSLNIGNYVICEYYGPISLEILNSYKSLQDFKKDYPNITFKSKYFAKLRYKGKSGIAFAKYNKIDCIKVIQNFYKQYSRIPTARDIQYPSVDTVVKLFGSWSLGIEAAGFNPNRTSWSKEECILAIQKFSKENNRIPQQREFLYNINCPSYGIVIKHFESWNKAIEAAGFVPNTKYSLGIKTMGKDKVLYMSQAEAYLVDKYFFGKEKYIYEPTYPNSKWLFDFYLPDYNLYIELDGGFTDVLNDYRTKMNNKIQYCKDNNIKLLVIKITDIYKKSFNISDFLKR